MESHNKSTVKKVRFQLPQIELSPNEMDHEISSTTIKSFGLTYSTPKSNISNSEKTFPNSCSAIKQNSKETNTNKTPSESSKIKVQLYRAELLHHLLTMHHHSHKKQTMQQKFDVTRRRLEF